jgi:hypothetical protein
MAINQELSSRPALMRKYQFSLGTLLLLPLILSPTFLAIHDASRIIQRSSSRSGMEGLALGFIYPFALTFIAYNRRTAAGTVNRRLFWWCLLRGTSLGILFFCLWVMPVAITETVVGYIAPRPWTTRVLFVMMSLGFATFFGSVIGAAAGGILGLFLPRRQTQPEQSQ